MLIYANINLSEIGKWFWEEEGVQEGGREWMMHHLILIIAFRYWNFIIEFKYNCIHLFPFFAKILITKENLISLRSYHPVISVKYCIVEIIKLINAMLLTIDFISFSFNSYYLFIQTFILLFISNFQI